MRFRLWHRHFWEHYTILRTWHGSVCLAQVIVSGIMLLGIFVQKKENVLKRLRLFVKIPLEYVEGVCKIGIPTALQGMAYCFISMIMTRMVAGFGPEAIATQRVGALSGLGRTRLCSVISIAFTSLRIPLRSF